MMPGWESTETVRRSGATKVTGSVPEFPGIPGSRLDASLPLPDLHRKRLVFNQFTKPGQIHVYSAACSAGERLRLQMLTPALPAGGAVSPSVALVGRSLPYSADVERLPFPVPAGFSAIVAAAPQELSASFRDWATQTRYYAGPGVDTRMLVAGRCYVVVWSPQNQMGKYVLHLGVDGQPDWPYWVRLPLFWWQIRGWFGLSRAGAYVAGALLLSALLLGRRGRRSR